MILNNTQYRCIKNKFDDEKKNETKLYYCKNLIISSYNRSVNFMMSYRLCVWK